MERPVSQPPAQRHDVVCIGEPMIEFNQTAPERPQVLQGFGGDTSNAALAAARSGVDGLRAEGHATAGIEMLTASVEFAEGRVAAALARL